MLFDVGIRNLVCWFLLWWRSGAYHFWSLLPWHWLLASFLGFSCLEHISNITANFPRMCLMLDQFLWGHSSHDCDISCFWKSQVMLHIKLKWKKCRPTCKLNHWLYTHPWPLGLDWKGTWQFVERHFVERHFVEYNNYYKDNWSTMTVCRMRHLLYSFFYLQHLVEKKL